MHKGPNDPILAELLLIGKDLIASLSRAQSDALCDRNLPFHLNPVRDTEDVDLTKGMQLSTLLPDLSAKETGLLACSQWQACTPCLTNFTIESNLKTFPGQMTLHWTEAERMEDFV